MSTGDDSWQHALATDGGGEVTEAVHAVQPHLPKLLVARHEQLPHDCSGHNKTKRVRENRQPGTGARRYAEQETGC